MKSIIGQVDSVYLGSADIDDLGKQACTSLLAELDGLVGVVEVAGAINAGDDVIVEIYKPPIWLARLAGSAEEA